MKDIFYEFTDIDSDDSFQLLGRSLGGVLQGRSLYFDNHIAKGELVKSSPEEGLWLRKWKLTVFQNILLHKVPPPVAEEKKMILIYFLNPAIFSLKNKNKKVSVTGSRNNMFFTSDVTMDFSVIPKQPFYVLDIAFTASWLSEQFNDADSSVKEVLEQYINKSTSTVMVEPSTAEEYQMLHELELSMLADNQDVLFIKSRVYNLIVSFFSKVVNRKETAFIQSDVRYDQLMQAEMLMMQNIQKPPRVEAIARKVNLSVSSLFRQFKLIYGKSIYEYYLEKKMELAKKMMLEHKIPVNEMAKLLGYKQASPFIETFTRQHGCSPGALKSVSEELLFF